MQDTTENQVKAYSEKLLSGEAFRNIARAEGGRRGFDAAFMVKTEKVARTYSALGRLASIESHSNAAYMELAHKAMSAVNPYAADNDFVRQIAERIAAAITEGYFDVGRATGPEAGRRSDHRRPYSLNEVLAAMLYVCVIQDKAPGWVLDNLINEVGSMDIRQRYEAYKALRESCANWGIKTRVP